MSYQLKNFKLRLFTCALMTFFLSLSGCREPAPELPKGMLSGTIRSNGEICGDCRVGLSSPVTKGSQGYTVGESGEYIFNHVPNGEYDVVVYQKPSNDPNPPLDRRIPKKYRRPETSGLKVTLKAGEEIVLDIDMKK